MKENKYDQPAFFEQYSRMARSVQGLEGAGEWHVLRRMLPDFRGKRVLDLGCGFGWHCRYAAEQGAAAVVGVDLSERMLEVARERNRFDNVAYECKAIEDFEFVPDSFDVVVSSLAFHYLDSFDAVCERVYRCLSSGGAFVFSVEHPVFTASGRQDWVYGDGGERLHWPVDRYFSPGRREACFLGESVTKYHRTVEEYVGCLLARGFALKGLAEPQPDEKAVRDVPGMADELRRPIFLILSAVKA